MGTVASLTQSVHYNHVHLTSNQVLTHAARAAAKQLNKKKAAFQAPLVAARAGAREGLWLEQITMCFRKLRARRLTGDARLE